MTPKPLEESTRNQIEQIFRTGDDSEELLMMFEDVMAAEQYWREKAEQMQVELGSWTIKNLRQNEP